MKRRSKIAPHERTAIVELGKTGLSYQRIAIRMKLSQSSVLKILNEHGVKPVGIKEIRKRLGMGRGTLKIVALGVKKDE
jgi:DNA invertase Pin-like site-specific DNA recombinase